jgi:hypothetical protein
MVRTVLIALLLLASCNGSALPEAPAALVDLDIQVMSPEGQLARRAPDATGRLTFTTGEGLLFGLTNRQKAEGRGWVFATSPEGHVILLFPRPGLGASFRAPPRVVGQPLGPLVNTRHAFGTWPAGPMTIWTFVGPPDAANTLHTELAAKVQARCPTGGTRCDVPADAFAPFLFSQTVAERK